MQGKDKMFIEIKGKMIEFPLHLIEVEICSKNKREAPTIKISSIAENIEEMEHWGELAAETSCLEEE